MPERRISSLGVLEVGGDREKKNVLLSSYFFLLFRQVGRDPPAATHPTERNENENENENEKNENENSRTPAGPQTNAPRDNLTPCGSPTPHSNEYLTAGPDMIP